MSFNTKKGNNAAIYLNQMTAFDYFDRLKMIVLSLFEWEGLPDSCNARFLEKCLFDYGYALFCFDNQFGYLTLKCTPSGELNYYDEPIKYTTYGTGLLGRRTYTTDEAVFIRNNILEKPSVTTIQLFAYRLTEAERTIDVNIKAQKTPVIIKCTDKEKLSMMNIFNQYEGNEPLIVASKSFDTSNFEVFKTDAPFVADKVQEYKRQIWYEALNTFGIRTANTEKRERLITPEVNANMEQVSIMAQTMLKTRQEACEQINKKFGLNVSVKMREFTDDEIALPEGSDNDWQNTQ